MGISIYPFHGREADTLVKNADLAMYRAKELGGDRVEFFKMNLLEEIKEEMSLEKELRKAVDRNEFTMVYQPKINLTTRSVTGVEALIRWNHPEKGMISPVRFIPLSEKIRLIIPITEFVIRRVCEDMIKWKRDGFPLYASR